MIKLSALAKEWGFNIHKESDLENFLFKFTELTKQDFVTLYVEIKGIILKQQHTKIFIEFLLALVENKINFQGIDIETKGMTQEYILSAECTDIRNKHMAEKYLSSEVPFFALVGSNHIAGLQNYLIQMDKNASKHYLFFNIYSHKVPPLSENEAELLPIKPISLNANEINEEQITNAILSNINLKISNNNLFFFAQHSIHSEASGDQNKINSTQNKY